MSIRIEEVKKPAESDIRVKNSNVSEVSDVKRVTVPQIPQIKNPG